MQHLEEGMIHAWLDGALPADESARVEQHTKECAECAAMIADARGLIAGASRIVSALDVAPSGVIPKQSITTKVRTQRSLWSTLHLTPFRAALAASVMVAVASMFAVRGDKSNGPKLERIVMSTQVPTATPAASLSPEAPEARITKRAADVATSAPVQTKQRQQAGAAGAAGARAANDSIARVVDAPKVAMKATDAVLPVPAPAASPPTQPAQEMRAQSLAESRVMQADSVARVSGFSLNRRAAVEPMRLTGVSVATARAFEGCYRVMTDSADWPRPLPMRFALTQAAATADARERNVVRLIDSAGRPDTSVAGTWRVVTDTLANVTWTGGGVRSAFAINQSASVTTVQALTGAPVRPVRVARASCQR